MTVNDDTCRTCTLTDALGVRVHPTPGLDELALWLPAHGIVLVDDDLTHQQLHEAVESCLVLSRAP